MIGIESPHPIGLAIKRFHSPVSKLPFRYGWDPRQLDPNRSDGWAISWLIGDALDGLCTVGSDIRFRARPGILWAGGGGILGSQSASVLWSAFSSVLQNAFVSRNSFFENGNVRLLIYPQHPLLLWQHYLHCIELEKPNRRRARTNL